MNFGVWIMETSNFLFVTSPFWRSNFFSPQFHLTVKNFNVFLFSFFVDVHTSLWFFSSIVSTSFVTCEFHHPWHVNLLVISCGTMYIGMWSKVYLQFVCYICFWICNLVMFQCFLFHCALYNMHLWVKLRSKEPHASR